MRYTSTHKSINSIVIPVMVLAGLGILMVYSSSVFISIAKYGDSFHYLWKHLINLGIGCAVLIFLSRLDYHVLRNLVWPLLILSLILLALVFVPGIGVSAGAKSEVKRWINLGFLTFQPSELVKISVVLFMSDYISRNAHRMKELRSGVVLPLAVIAVFQAIILFQPDFGSVMSIGILSLAMMFAGGIRWKHVFGIVGISFPIVCFLIL
jgi:cell division protein FtsW